MAKNILNKQTRISDEGWSFSFGVGRSANNPHRKNEGCYEIISHDLEHELILGAQVSSRWRALVNTVMNLCIP